MKSHRSYIHLKSNFTLPSRNGSRDRERSHLETQSNRSHTPTSVPEKALQVFQSGEAASNCQKQTGNNPGVKFDRQTDHIDLDIFDKQTLCFEKAFGEKQSNLRFYTFVWLQLFYFEGADFNETNAGIRERMLEDISQFFKSLNTPKVIRNSKSADQDERLITDIIMLYRSRAYAQEKTLWIKSSTRSKNWIARKLKNLDHLSLYKLPNLSGHELSQAIIDQWDYPIADKISSLDSWATQWRKNLKADAEAKWLNVPEHAKTRRSEFWNYVCEKHADIFSVDQEPKSHDDVLEIFDQLAEAGVGKTKIISDLKKLEREASPEKAPTRSQINVALLPDTIEKLAALSEHFELLRQYTVEKIIKDAHASILGGAKRSRTDAPNAGIPNGIPT